MSGTVTSSSSPTATVARLALALLLSCAAVTASATKPTNIADAEMAMIPKYCPDTMGFNYGDAYFNTSPRAAGWVALMGKSFWAIHHYCWALINLGRATRPGVPPEIRKGTLENVRSDYQYVIDHSTPDFVLLPEVYTRMGDVELLLANPNKANEAFARARQLKPDYWPAYSRWADFLIRSGNRAQAKDMIRNGLEYSPAAKVLLQQYRLLGGNPSEIVPKALPAADAAATDEIRPDAPQSVDSGAAANSESAKPDVSAK